MLINLPSTIGEAYVAASCVVLFANCAHAVILKLDVIITATAKFRVYLTPRSEVV